MWPTHPALRVSIGIFQFSGFQNMNTANDTHSKTIGYVLWLFGFTGAHRFYYGRPVTGTIWFFTLGLLGIGWIIDLFLIPGMDREADLRFRAGRVNYSLAWVLLAFLGLFGVHRMYMGKWVTGIIYLCTVGLLGIGYLYDFWTLNDQITVVNASE
ncbi:MAG: TM2 domain-containing protein [Burkholderiales bacterium]|nr:TM2 domain-containing protein [Burkholderiales bacterium]